MWYIPFLRARRAFLIYAAILLAAIVVALLVRFWPGLTVHSGHQPFSVRSFTIDGWPMLVFSSAAVVILATILGLNLAAENDGHLEVAWTKPASRERYALTLFAIDIGALVLAIVLTFVSAIVVTDIFLGHQAISFFGAASHQTFSAVGIPQSTDVGREAFDSIAYMTFPICIYAWITALSASLKRNRGAIAGMFWPVMLGLTGIQVLPVPALHAVFKAINRIDPLTLYNHPAGVPNFTFVPYGGGMLSIVVLLALALVQWRRLEA